jgi:acyl phosphate:glycerol-3-phosphate acyltransferase
MDKALFYIIVALAGYLIGSVSPARIIFSKLRPGKEPDRIRTPTTDGQAELVAHNIGATNVMIAFGARWSLLTTAIDAAKAFIPTLALRLAFPGESFHLVYAAAVLVGHLWPLWYKFRDGGGGNSCILGMLLAISPVGLIVSHIAGMLIGRLVPVLTFLGGVIFTIPWFAWQNGVLSPETAFAVAITLLYIAGQLPEAIQIAKLRSEGHKIDPRHVMRMMRRSVTNKGPKGSVDKNLDDSGGT